LVKQFATVPDSRRSESRYELTFITLQGLQLAAGNCLVALLFFCALLPSALRYGNGVASDIWITGAAVMGVFSLVRVPPSAVTLTLSSVVATSGALIIPALMHPVAQPGLMLSAGIVVETAGVTLSQVARLYMGRSFGVMPANRGVVSNGPFRFVRHPVYLGWLVLALGFVLANPSALNVACLAVTPIFTEWRIVLEEKLLSKDPEYRAYTQKVLYQLLPGVL
jgi:protein-S-isoprenylcysteine O-methyltransferase Ste14